MTAPPGWLGDLLGGPLPAEGGSMVAHGRPLTLIGGIPRAAELHSAAQAQTRETFGFKWARRDTYEGGVASHAARWLAEKYGDPAAAAWLDEHGPAPLLLDAGCGAALSALALFAPVLHRIRYLGVDVSTAVEVAARRFAERGLSGRVRLLPAYTQDEAPGLYRAADILIHPKYNDPCPTVPIEAMACGLPVVGSRSGGMEELVPTGAGALIDVPRGYEREHWPSGAAVADAVVRVAADWERYSSAARENAVARLDIGRWLDRHEALFNELLGAGR